MIFMRDFNILLAMYVDKHKVCSIGFVMGIFLTRGPKAAYVHGKMSLQMFF